MELFSWEKMKAHICPSDELLYFGNVKTIEKVLHGQ